MIENVPTHAEVARALNPTHPEMAQWVASEEDWCWGDLILEAQRLWEPEEVADAIQILCAAGWGECIRYTWCPLTRELDNAYIGALARMDGQRSRMADRTIYGTVITKIRLVWRKARADWMKAYGVEEGHGEALESMIDLYLRRKQLEG